MNFHDDNTTKDRRARRSWLPKGTALLIAALAVLFYGRILVRHFGEIPVMTWDLRAVIASVISVILATLIVVIGGVIWLYLLRDRGMSIRWSQAVYIFSVAQFGKYLPGNIGHYLGRVAMARDAGVPVTVSLGTMLLETLWGTAVATGIAVVALLLYGGTLTVDTPWHLGPLPTLLLALSILVLPQLGTAALNTCLPSIARRLTGEGPIAQPKVFTALGTALLFLMCFIVMGLIVKLQLLGLFGSAVGTLPQLTCLFALAWMGGYIVPGAPGGLGVREALLVMLLTPLLGAGTALGLSITLRITTTLGDAMACLLGLAVQAHTKPKNAVRTRKTSG